MHVHKIHEFEIISDASPGLGNLMKHVGICITPGVAAT